MQKKIVSIRETVHNTSVTQCSSHYGSPDSEFVASDSCGTVQSTGDKNTKLE